MISQHTFEGRLQHRADGEAITGSGFGKLLLVVEGDAAHEVDGGWFWVQRRKFRLERKDVALEELVETVEQERVDGRMPPVS